MKSTPRATPLASPAVSPAAPTPDPTAGERPALAATPQRMERLADFAHEVGMLRRTPRSGYQFLGTGRENVAEHSHRTTVLGYVLARLAGADVARTVYLCLFHDLHEARTGDFNYVNHRYNTCNARQALADATVGTGLEDDVLDAFAELEGNSSTEARLAHDADQLDLIFNLKCESERGNAEAESWMDAACCRLKTPQGQELARYARSTPSGRWWRAGVDAAWWNNRR